MLDTLGFDIKAGLYMINDPEMFHPTADILISKPAALYGERLFLRHKLSDDKKQYYPQVSLY